MDRLIIADALSWIVCLIPISFIGSQFGLHVRLSPSYSLRINTSNAYRILFKIFKNDLTKNYD